MTNSLESSCSHPFRNLSARVTVSSVFVRVYVVAVTTISVVSQLARRGLSVSAYGYLKERAVRLPWRISKLPLVTFLTTKIKSKVYSSRPK